MTTDSNPDDWLSRGERRFLDLWTVSTEGGSPLFRVLFGVASVLAWRGVKLVFWYGVAVIVFRHAFGLELPHPDLSGLLRLS